MLLSSATVRDLDRLTARVFDTATRSSGARLDAYRIDDHFYIDIDLPGIDPAGIDITVDHNVLTVRAERKRRADGEDAETIVAERPSGPVSRQVFLSDTLDTDRLEARYEQGVLILDIPVAVAQPRKVAVTVA
ncbi:Hsp20/alpha crystallin family protein [Paractinoplanes atraurantiacus]|uniref:HSP20 family protein n=1 Tax=Paractinoplanes atraurantiacus TaxID=1036182 RepID=A0A285IQF5_9ACTN|nr:Hsp20/alpha crystallin family protein [Actinoplanes atraurantiacus]SNY50255.1 HSP20 family protein [Actinoplanes atraurantiacus]